MAVGDTQDRIRILLVDDLVLAREALSRFLGSQPEFAIAGLCGSTADALDLLQRMSVDVVIIENRLTNHRGAGFIPEALDAGFQGRILVIADPTEFESSGHILPAQVARIFPRDNPLDSLVQAIHEVALRSSPAWNS